jgi:hypothetical protein
MILISSYLMYSYRKKIIWWNPSAVLYAVLMTILIIRNLQIH